MILQNKKAKVALLGIAIASAIIALPSLYLNQQKKSIKQTNLKQKLKKFLPIFKWKNTQEKYSQSEVIVIKNKNELIKKIKAMRIGGFQNLQIVSDFDQTITPFYYQGKHAPSSLGSIRQSPFVKKELSEGMTQSFQKYHPIEQDISLPLDQKMAYMQEWNEVVEDMFAKSELTLDIIQKTIDQSNYATRYGFENLFQNCYKLNLPFYVVSGGLNVIVNTILGGILDIDNYQNLFALTNELHFDRNGKVLDLQMKINTSSKQTSLNKKDYEFKKNTILFGDSNTDLLMSKEMGSENLINVLFVKDSQKNEINELLDQGWDLILYSKSEDNQQAGFLIPQIILEFIGQDDNYNYEISDEDLKNYQQNPQYQEIRNLLENI